MEGRRITAYRDLLSFFFFSLPFWDTTCVSLEYLKKSVQIQKERFPDIRIYSIAFFFFLGGGGGGGGIYEQKQDSNFKEGMKLCIFQT